VPAGSDYYGAITYLAEEGVVSGYANGNFGPNDRVTRQQFAKMIVRAVGYAVFTSDVCPYTDVPTSSPGHYVDDADPLYPDHYVAVAAGRHITVGLGGSTFGPYQNIKMAQATTMVVRTAEDLGLWDSPPHSYSPPFEDFGEPHYSYARTGAAHDLFNAYPGSWDWFSPATRGQCAFFICKLIIAYHGAGGPELVP
jgi:serine protease Do